MGTITFVLGRDHYSATLYIRRKVRDGAPANQFRNITNPNTVRKLRSTENTTVEFVFLPGSDLNRKYADFRKELDERKLSNAGIVEGNDE